MGEGGFPKNYMGGGRQNVFIPTPPSGSPMEWPLQHSQKRIMKPFAFTKPHDFRVFAKEYS